MTSLAIKNLLAHRRRFIGTFLASFLGVAFLAGTLVLGDTLQRNFDTMFTDANAGTDAANSQLPKLIFTPYCAASETPIGLAEVAVSQSAEETLRLAMPQNMR